MRRDAPRCALIHCDAQFNVVPKTATICIGITNIKYEKQTKHKVQTILDSLRLKIFLADTEIVELRLRADLQSKKCIYFEVF